MKLILITLTVFTFQNLFAQLRVDPNGNVGIGTTWPNPDHKLDVRGDILMTNYPAIPDHSIRFRLWNGGPGPEFAIKDDNLIFWETWTTYHNLHAANYYKISDLKYKSNISEIRNGTQLISQLRPVYYNIVDNKYDSLGNQITGSSKQFGFISQEVKKEFPDVDMTASIKEDVLLDYDQIIPITVSAIQEQQKIIDSIKVELLILKNQLNLNKSLNLENENSAISSPLNILWQNSPNPFNQSTEVKFSIEEQNFRNASIVIFDMNGLLIKKYDIQKSGEGTIKINGNELKAGMYIYTLIINQREVDSKRMILLN